ncbi:hypothetical protein DY000_02023837 [Brassica cretica]|uniref:Uncharacterized protein n=1 Tax=Brassica cretica TaxID=69181 RepID=A0ABQ7E4U7_BRACR|nr:hypothetical protein DY000_02023837 [Brassica cretica]
MILIQSNCDRIASPELTSSAVFELRTVNKLVNKRDEDSSVGLREGLMLRSHAELEPDGDDDSSVEVTTERSSEDSSVE